MCALPQTRCRSFNIDTHLVHEVTSPQAFEGLRLNNRKVRHPDLTFATMDHNVPTTDRSLPITDLIAAKQMETLAQNCAEFDVPLYDIDSPEQGIVHVIGPELGITQPAKPSCAAIVIPQRTVHSAHSPSELAQAKLSMSSPRNASCNRNRKPLRSALTAFYLTA